VAFASRGDLTARAHGLDWSFDPGALMVTVGKFYRPSGASTQLRGVRSTVVIPSLTDLEDIGEAELDHPLPWDTVPPAVHDRAGGVVAVGPQLRKLSAERVATNPVFAEVEQSLAATRSRLHTGLTLNEAQRREQLARESARREALVRWWKARAAVAPASYEIRVKDSADTGLPAPEPFASFDAKLAARAERAGSSTELVMLAAAAADDVVLQEAMRVLADYVSALDSAKSVRSADSTLSAR
jgi:C-terminal domain of tail specific protease (DUF3340)